MRKSNRQSKLRFIGAILIVGAGGLLFQNCGTYQAGDSGINLSTACDVDASNCANVVLNEGILMSIANPSIQLLSAQTSFDVGGYCDNGTFSATTSKLQYKILNTDNSATAICNSADPDCWIDANDSSGAVSRCVNGRYTFNVPAVPAHTSGTAYLFVLESRLVEYDSTAPSVVVTNAVGRATQTITIYISAN